MTLMWRWIQLSMVMYTLHKACFKDLLYVCSDGLRAEGSEWVAEEGEGRLEQVDSGTESADDRYSNSTTEVILTLCTSISECCLPNHMVCFVHSEKMARVIAEETQQLVTDLNEERSRYQNLLTEHLRLEEKYDDLKEALSSVRQSVIAVFTETDTFVISY